MLINSSGNSIYFTLFYSLAFFFAFMMLLWEGYQRKIPMIPWLLLLIFSRVAFIAGTKIFTYNLDDWLLMIRQMTLIPTSEKNLLGGILFGVMAIVAGKYILRIRQSILDAFAIIVPVSFGIQKIGCFLNGCCFGKPTSMPWSVRYPANSLPHYFQFESGRISADNLLSLHIHPVQLYEMAGAFLVAFLVFKTRKYWKANGSLFVFSILLFCVARFLTEFFRDNQAHTIGGEMFGFLNQIQWAMLIAVFIFFLILLYREKKMVLHVKFPLQSASIGIKFGLVIFILESILIWTLRNWFSPSERIAILLTFFISGIIIFLWILKEIASSKTRLIYAGLLILPLLITSQTIPQVNNDSTLVIKTPKISFGVTSGSFENYLNKKIGTSSDGCAQYQSEYFKEKSIVGGGGYSVKSEYPEKKYSKYYGVNVYMGQNTEVIRSDGSESKTFLYGINPFLKFETNWLGVGGGIHLGNLVYPISQKDYSGNLATGLVKTAVFPQAYLRFGPKRFFFVDYHLADQFISPFPAYFQELGLGTSFGFRNETNFRVGIIPNITSNYYFSAYLPLFKEFSVEPMLLLSSYTQFSIGLHYNLPSKSYHKKLNIN